LGLNVDGCHYWRRDLEGFNLWAAQATDAQTGYTIVEFSVDISGWSDATIAVYMADCSDTNDWTSCTNMEPVSTNWAGLAADWTLRAAHIEHTDTAVTYHFALTVYEFAREGSYLIGVYDAGDGFSNGIPVTYEFYPRVIQLQDLGQYGYLFADRGQDSSYNNPVCDVDDDCQLYSNSDQLYSEYEFQILMKKYGTNIGHYSLHGEGVSYPGEAVYGQFSASEATNFDTRFGVSFVLIPGVC
jgi:hypothetical protein